MIVTGILIALSLEQLVEAIHWHHQVESAERALGIELSDSDGQSFEREIVSDCVDRRLDELAVVIDEADRSGKLPAVGEFYMPPSRSWNVGTWQSTLSGQTAEHLSSERRARYASLYGFVALMATTNEKEGDIWTKLHAIVGPGRKIEPGELASLRIMVSEARMGNQWMGMGAVRLQEIARNFILPDAVIEKFYRSKAAADFPICQPVGAAPEHYGAAPMTHGIEHARSIALPLPSSLGSGPSGSNKDLKN